MLRGFGEQLLGRSSAPDYPPFFVDYPPFFVNYPPFFVKVKGVMAGAYLIFVANITNEICGEKVVMWRNFRFICMRDVAKSEISLHVE